jgi:competence protein ComEC
MGWTVGLLAIAFFYRAGGCYLELGDLTGLDLTGNNTVEDMGSGDAASSSSGGMTNVHFLDVGQGDSILICGTEKNILIDGGERDQGDTVLADLKTYGVDTIDCIIASHPHSDHIGGLVDVLNYAAQNDDLSVEEVVLSEIPEQDIPTTAVYSKFLDGVEANGLSVTYADYEMTIDIGSGTMTIYPPVSGKDYSSLNDYSLCAYLECGNTSFFFTGDMETPEETDLLASGCFDGLQATVLKAGHHGSNTSSSAALLDQLSPDYAVISCGTGNKYGHPHAETLSRLESYCKEVYRTDQEGTITCTTDGTTLAWSTGGN